MTDQVHTIAKDKIRSMIERIERLEEEKKQIADDIKEVYGEAKALGFDSKILRKCIMVRKKDKSDFAEEQMILKVYLEALGEDIDVTAV